jgi:hypothetical protein
MILPGGGERSAPVEVVEPNGFHLKALTPVWAGCDPTVGREEQVASYEVIMEGSPER